MNARAERVLFREGRNGRIIRPLSKLAASKWLTDRASIDGLDELDEDAC